MVQIEQIINTWSLISNHIALPKNEAELDKLIEIADYLVDQLADKEDETLLNLLNIVGYLIKEYEDIHYQKPDHDPIGCLKYLMEEHGLKQKDMVEIGNPSVVSEVLSGKRELNKRMIKALSERFNCSIEIFI